MQIDREVVRSVGRLASTLYADKVSTSEGWSSWARSNTRRLEKIFGYTQLTGMPAVYTLVKPFFHPTEPLIGFNYTQTAHNTLHEFPGGWTSAIRICRGIVFDGGGSLVALPFPKFFNYGEHEETRNLPNEPFEATVKHDGHLGIIFQYMSGFHLTTRGDFGSRTSLLGNKMLAKYVARPEWASWFPLEVTLLVEIIHPQTQVYVDYGGAEQFTIIGAYHNLPLQDYNYTGLTRLGELLRLPVSERWTGKGIDELVMLMADRSVENQEGYVVRFASGLRVKLKYQTYIGKMVADKLSYTYLMRRWMTGNLQRMLDTLPEELYETALRMVGQIFVTMNGTGTPQEKWRRLYEILPEDQSTAYYQGVCREFVKHMMHV